MLYVEKGRTIFSKFQHKKLMISYFIYIIVFIILVFVVHTAVKFASIGIKEKDRLKKEKSVSDEEKLNKETNIVFELEKLENLRKSGSISDEEFLKAKEKIFKE